MTTPRLTEVFILEASMHAWKMLGLSPEDKRRMEEYFGQVAYEMALAFLGEINYVRKFGPDPDIVDIIMACVESNGEGSDEELVLRQVRLNSKFRAELRKLGPTIISDPENSFVSIARLANSTSIPEPKQYNAPENRILELAGGWAWVNVCDDAARSFEGSAMQHCGVSNQQMYSLRDPNGKPHVTVDMNPKILWVGQLRGKQNEVPDEKYWPQIFQFFEFMANGKGKIEFEDPKYIEQEGSLGARFIEQGIRDRILFVPEPESYGYGDA